MNYFKLIILLCLCVLSGCSLLMPIEYLDNDNKVRSSMTDAEKVWHVMNVIDTAQTINIARAPECYKESNPLTRALIGEHPSTGNVIAIGVLYSVLYRAANQYIEDHNIINSDGYFDTGWGYAKLGLDVLGLATKGFTIGHNHTIGLRPFGSGCGN